ncbi:unnamed protein product [Durusdinium trenchii]
MCLADKLQLSKLAQKVRQAKDRASRSAKPGIHFYGVKLVHISWPDADDLLSNALEFDNEVEGPWPLGRRAALQIRWISDHIQFRILPYELAHADMMGIGPIPPITKTPQVLTVDASNKPAECFMFMIFWVCLLFVFNKSLQRHGVLWDHGIEVDITDDPMSDCPTLPACVAKPL